MKKEEKLIKQLEKYREKERIKREKKAAKLHKKFLRNNRKNSPIGGQAVMEGVMMRGETAMAIAVRDADKVIRIETKRVKPTKERNIFFRLPIIRGIINFIMSMVMGVKTLIRSAEVYGEEEPSKFEKWFAKKFKVDLLNVMLGFSIFLSLALAIGIFIIAPGFLTKLIAGAFKTPPSIFVFNLIDGAIRLTIFILYVVCVGLVKDVRRVFMYHGAEHRTINAYEQGLELTVENVQSCSTCHQRCGTTFMFLVMVISILVFSFVSWDNLFINILVKIALLPLVAGISYEILKGLAKTNAKWAYIFKAPGLALQLLTTRKPTDDIAEVAIASFKAVMEMDKDKDVPERQFELPKKREQYFNELKEKFENANIDISDLEWIFATVMKLKRSEITLRELVTVKEVGIIEDIVARRLNGEPLQYILGNTEFYGYIINTDKRVLIPRMDTEILVEQALKNIKKDSLVLDLCTGSGCIAIAVKGESNAKVSAIDISQDALNLAKENAELNKVDIEFIESDMFTALQDRKFDVIISNPPYIKKKDIETLDREVKDFEPVLALEGGEDGLDYYRKISAECEKYLNENGKLFMEVGIDQAKDVEKLFDGKDVEIIKDLNGIERVVKVNF